jgi:hypothetical protein
VKDNTNLVLTVAAGVRDLLGPDIDMRFSAFRIIVFILVNIWRPTLFFSFSWSSTFSGSLPLSLGTEGPPWAGELILTLGGGCAASQPREYDGFAAVKVASVGRVWVCLL